MGKKKAEVATTVDVLVTVREKIGGMKAMIEATVVSNEDELKVASDRIKQIKTLGAFIQQEKDKIVKPLKLVIKETGEKYDPFLKECENAEIILKSRAKKYLDEKEEKRLADEKKITDAAAAGRLKPETAVKKLEALPTQEKTVRSENSGIRRTVKSVAVIVDPNLVPDTYWIIDEVLAKKAALTRFNEGAGREAIPGIIIKDESVISSV